MINVLVNGCNGKMGQEVVNQIEENKDFLVIAGFDRENLGNTSYPVYNTFSSITVKPDVIIDFSVPVATLNILEYAKANSIPVVIATTGFSEEQLKKVEEYSNYIPIFKSANTSYDINLMAKLLEQIAPILRECDIEIIETHHNRKIDAPSGTALLLADSINKSLDNSMEYNFDRFSSREKRKSNEIGFPSIRGGNIVGEHTVKFFSPFETFEISHTSYSRSVFADGALKAAKFIIHQKPGLYNMSNLIK